MSKVLLVEFNELCPSLMDGWIKSGDLPNFASLQETSDCYITEADVNDPINLEPWIQWFSLHTGSPFEKHRVFHLTDGPNSTEEDIWQLLRSKGKRVGCFSSMNVRGFSSETDFYIPDPWCTSEQASPRPYQTYHDFVSYMVREYTNDRAGLTISDILKFGYFLLTHGLRLKTVVRLVNQLAQEKLSKTNVSWKRAASLDDIQIDIFRHAYKNHNPDFATYFSNSTAHLQHTYWRCMEPEAFSIKPSPQEINTYSNAIKFGYQRMDWQLGELRKLVDDNTTVIFATALSQQPFIKGDSYGGQHFYRPYDVEQMLKQFGIRAADVQPTMTHQFMARFENQTQVTDAMSILNDIVVDGDELFESHIGDDDYSIYFGCQIFGDVDEDSTVFSKSIGGVNLPFSKWMYKIDGIKSGCHHPDGMLWISRGKAKKHTEKVSILDVFPTIASLMGVTPEKNYEGKSLV